MTNTNTLVVFDEAAAIDEVATWVETVQEKMTAGYSRQWLEDELVTLLRQGTMAELRIIEAAEKDDDEIADAALRRVWSEITNRHEQPSVLLSSFAMKVVNRGEPIKRGRGHYWYDNWRRDFGVVVLVYLTHRRFNLTPTRNREQRRRLTPSASSIVTAALGRHRVNVAEKSVENIWGALSGHVGRFLLTGQI